MGSDWLYIMDIEGRTPLDRAVQCGHHAVAELMLHQHVYDSAACPDRTTPLHRAAFLGLTEAVKSLLAYGAHPSAADGCGEIPLHKAVREGHAATVEILAGVSDVNSTSDSGMTPLHWACLTGNREVIDTLLFRGADPWIRNEYLDGLTPGELADAMGYPQLAHLFPGGAHVAAA